jgi:hypothetical protein
MPLVFASIYRRVTANPRSKWGACLLLAAALIPACVYGYSKSINWNPVELPISLRAGHIEQSFRVNYTARYFADIEFQVGSLSQQQLQCLTGITGFSPKPACSEKSVLNFKWQLFRNGSEISSGRYTGHEGASLSYDSVGAGFTYFDAQRGEKYKLVVDVDSGAQQLDAARPTLYVCVNSVNLEFVMVMQGLAKLFSMPLALLGLGLLISGLRSRPQAVATSA